MSLLPNNPTRASQAGYTLAELLVVLVVIALASALIGPRVLGNSPVRDQRAAMETVMDMAARARAQAIRTGREHTLTLNVDTRAIAISPSGDRRKLSDRVALDVVAAEAEIVDEVAGIRFFPDGAATGGAVSFEVEDARPRRVTIDWATGLAREDRS